jgi:S-formylglutathione hydrolase FrmB
LHFGSPAHGWGIRERGFLDKCNGRIAGHVVDFTANHGVDRRFWSQALCQKRDMYVYLPPGFDPNRQYPVIVFMHGFMADEKTLLYAVVRQVDAAITGGHLPPVIVAAPDGSLSGRASLFSAGSFFLNTKAGRFEDYLIQDVWGFLTAHFPIRPEREAHVLAGASMGGFAAFNLAMKYSDTFKVAVGIFPPLNLRWVDCHCEYFSEFDPCCWLWRTSVTNGHEVVGRFFHGAVKIRLKQIVDPLYGRGPDAVAAISHENPIEMLDRLQIADGQLDMYVAYGGKDEFNIGTQVDSFLYRARERGITVTWEYDPDGTHSFATALNFFPNMVRWLAPRIAPYSPPCGARASEPAPPARP